MGFKKYLFYRIYGKDEYEGYVKENLDSSHFIGGIGSTWIFISVFLNNEAIAKKLLIFLSLSRIAPLYKQKGVIKIA